MTSSQYTQFLELSNILFSHLSIEEQAVKVAHHHDLISFLALLQHGGVDLLPIKWQPALNHLGFGGTAQVNQGLINAQLNYAFKRIKVPGRLKDEIEKWAAEVLLLSHPQIRHHPNIARLEGCCLEVLTSGKVAPVLISEKAALGDLENFMASYSAEEIPLEIWFDICLDIGSALKTIHNFNAIHGDVKPSNILVYRDKQGRYSMRVTDFGFACIGANEDSLVQLPYSPLWTAPDHHGRYFRIQDAKKMDVYSYGLLCYWILISKLDTGNSLLGLDMWKDLRALETMKQKNNELLRHAEAVLSHTSELNLLQKEKLLRFFASVLGEKHQDRVGDWIVLLSMLRYVSTATSPKSLIEEEPCASIAKLDEETNFHLQFRISEYLLSLAVSDHRIRVSLVKQLEDTFNRDSCEPCGRNAAFQLAICSYTGFGNPDKDVDYKTWLIRSQFDQHAFDQELEHIRGISTPGYRQKSVDEIRDEFLFPKHLPHESRGIQGLELDLLMQRWMEEGDGCERAFGSTHLITIALKRELAELFNSRSMYNEAVLIQKGLIDVLGDDPVVLKVMLDLSLTYSLQGRTEDAVPLRIQVVESFKSSLGEEHAGSISALSNLASALSNLGYTSEAEELLLQVIDVKKRKFGLEHPSTSSSESMLSEVYFRQRRYLEAENLQLKIVDCREKILGKNHELTWTSQLNFAAIITMQGRLEEAAEIEEHILVLRKQCMGEQHPLTFTALSNLAMTYRQQKRWTDEAHLLNQVVEGRTLILGADHRDTIVSMQALSNNLLNQRLWDKAEPLLQKMVDIRSSLRGESHPSTLTSRTSLAWVRFDQGKYKEAEEMQLGTIAAGLKAHGEEHEDVINCSRHLAMMYKCQGRLEDARKLHNRVWSMRKRILRADHPDIRRSAEQIEEIDEMRAVIETK